MPAKVKIVPKANKIIAAIKADKCLIAEDLVNGKPKGCGHAGRCAMGALLFRGGMTNKALRQLNQGLEDLFRPDDWEVKGPGIAKAERILTKIYGITTQEQVGAIMVRNDSFRPKGRKPSKEYDTTMYWFDQKHFPKVGTLAQATLRADAIIQFVRERWGKKKKGA